MIFIANDSGPVLRTERHKSYLLKGLQHLSESYEVKRCCHACIIIIMMIVVMVMIMMMMMMVRFLWRHKVVAEADQISVQKMTA